MIDGLHTHTHTLIAGSYVVSHIYIIILKCICVSTVDSESKTVLCSAHLVLHI